MYYPEINQFTGAVIAELGADLLNDCRSFYETDILGTPGEVHHHKQVMERFVKSILYDICEMSRATILARRLLILARDSVNLYQLTEYCWKASVEEYNLHRDLFQAIDGLSRLTQRGDKDRIDNFKETIELPEDWRTRAHSYISNLFDNTLRESMYVK